MNFGSTGGRGAAGCVIMRIKSDTFTTSNTTGATVSTATVNSIVYSIFTWNTSGTLEII